MHYQDYSFTGTKRLNTSTIKKKGTMSENNDTKELLQGILIYKFILIDQYQQEDSILTDKYIMGT